MSPAPMQTVAAAPNAPAHAADAAGVPRRVAEIRSKKSFDSVRGLVGYSNVLPGIASLLATLVAQGDARRAASRKGTPPHALIFDGVEPAPLSVQDYLIRLFKYGLASPDVYVLAVIYISRFMRRTKIPLQSYNVHRVMLTAFAVAAKFHDDKFYSNKYYAKMGGVALEELNRMEVAFLEGCEWNMYVRAGEHTDFVKALTAEAMRRPAVAATPTPAAELAVKAGPGAPPRHAAATAAVCVPTRLHAHPAHPAKPLAAAVPVHAAFVPTF